MSRFVTPDWLLGGMGVGMATASASFAAYMIATAPAQVVGFGSKEFRIFAQYDRRPKAPVSGRPDRAPRTGEPTPAGPGPAPEVAPAAPQVAQAEAPGIDLEPTGSIAAAAGPAAPAHEAPGPTVPLATYKLRQVVGDHALLEHDNKLTVVRRGSVLPGVGEVLAIEQLNNRWVVRTAGGRIGGIAIER